MFEIVKKELLAPNIYLMDVMAPRVARTALPGQFVIVRTHDKGERIPLTICDYNANKGTVTIVTQVVGLSSRLIANLNEGDFILDFVGPLGQPSEFVHESEESLINKKFLFIAGGLGTAPIYPQIAWLSANNIKADVIIGAKNKELVILEDEMQAVAGNVYITTDDGSYGSKGIVTDMLKDLIDNQGKHYDEVIAIGPMIMMKFVSLATKPYKLKTIVSLNTLMVDGTGMCGACRVTVGGKTKFTCVDGPEFDGHLVDFDEALRRQGMYRNQEQSKNCKCFDGISDN